MSLIIGTSNWWDTDTYSVNAVLPLVLQPLELWGPKDAALVRVHGNGSTQEGWGLTGKDGADGFMRRYLRNEFAPRRALYGYDQGRHAVAFVMRSARLMCVDIDGKNGGLEHAGALGALPLTLAETSKSGNGYHLFYRTDEVWDETVGFDLIPDHIGIVQGVDIRGVGCVYHFPTQRWNTRAIAPLPVWLRDKLLVKKQQRSAAATNILKIQTLDETEILIMHADLLNELNKPVPAGRRNNTLFAIGQKLKLAEVPDWQQAVEARALDLGLDGIEAARLVSNIESYN